jgi:alpha-1,6-mannosyltransferase
LSRIGRAEGVGAALSLKHLATRVGLPLPGLLPLAVLLLAGEAAGLAAQLRHDIDAFILAVLLQGAVWALAVFAVNRNGERQSLALILGVAALLRLGALLAPIWLSTDIYRYIWDGRVAAAGINPYRYIPGDVHLSMLRDTVIFPHINRADYAPTIYPPVAELVFLVATRFGGAVAAMKLFMVALEAVGIAALVSVLRATGRPRRHILLYAWHPLPVWEIAGSGHVDAAVVMFVALALAAACAGRRTAGAAALAAATCVKFLPVVLVPALWRPTRANHGDWRWPSVFAGVILLSYLPYLSVGRRVLGFLPGYLGEENFVSGGGFWLLDLARRLAPVPTAAYFGFALIVMAGLAALALRQAAGVPGPLVWATRLASAALFLLSPHYAWYFVWLAALACAASWWPAWWPTVTAVLLYKQSATGVIPWAAGAVVYGGFAVLGSLDIIWRLVFCRRARGTA